MRLEASAGSRALESIALVRTAGVDVRQIKRHECKVGLAVHGSLEAYDVLVALDPAFNSEPPFPDL